MEALKEIDTTTEGYVLKKQWDTEVKKGTKNEYITFYREVLQAVDEAIISTDMTDDNDIGTFS